MRKIARGSLVLVAVALLVASLYFPVGYRRSEVCIDCGLYSQTREFFGISIPWDEQRTPMTDWFDRRVGGAHSHRWAWTGRGAMLEVWQGAVGFACGSGEPLAQSGWACAEILNALEPLDLDRPVHRALTHEDADYRKAAADAVLAVSFSEEWPVDERTFRAWWDEVQE